MSHTGSLIAADSGRVLIPRLQLAMTPWRRLVGLLGTSGLAPDEGLWLEPCNSVHLFGMRYALDVVFVDRQGRVLRLIRNLAPWRASPIVWGARAAIELAVGQIETLGMHLGQSLRVEPSKP